jgi:DNA-binding response OmpR family regulator
MTPVDNSTQGKILIVDDDHAFVMALARFLGGHGYQGLIAQDATFAIQNVVKNNISLVVLDLGLPCGGGLYVLENLCKIGRVSQFPIIVSTANVSPDIEQKVRDLGATDFILKPYDLEDLLKVIQARLS